VGNKSALDLRAANVECEKNKKDVRCETSSAKVTIIVYCLFIYFFFLSGNKPDDAVLAAAGVNTVKRAARLHYSKQYFLILR
jgi:hypothetical protein